MIERRVAAQQTTGEYQQALTVPMLFLSSEEAGWEDLVVRAYHEPMEIEGWVDPVLPDIALVALTRGTMLMEQRRANNAWKTQPIRQGDLMLKPAGSTTNELRWRSLSCEPMQTLHIHLNHALFCRTAEELADRCGALQP